MTQQKYPKENTTRSKGYLVHYVNRKLNSQIIKKPQEKNQRANTILNKNRDKALNSQVLGGIAIAKWMK